MAKLTTYFSPKYYQGITHLDQTGTKEYFLDTAIKPQWIYDSLKVFPKFRFAEPLTLIKQKDVLRVHSEEYIKSLKTGVPVELAFSSGLRWVPQLLDASLSSVNGCYSAALQALRENVSGTLSTNFHHAQKHHGSGFCVLNGTAITAKKLLEDKLVSKILILDCDYHYGDGNAEIFKDSTKVCVFDIYGGVHSEAVNIVKAPNLISHRVNSASDYFSKLDTLLNIVRSFKPEIVLYDAGMDVWENSRIGRIKGMNKANIKKRESLIFNLFMGESIPVAFTISGGYVRYKSENGILLSKEEQEENRLRLVEIHKITLEQAYQTYLKNSSYHPHK